MAGGILLLRSELSRVDLTTMSIGTILTTETFWYGPAMLGATGFIWTLVWSLILRTQLRERYLHSWLKEHGQRVRLENSEVIIQYHRMVNKKHPYRLSGSWKHAESQEEYFLESDDLWIDPTPYLKNRQVEVLFDPSNPATRSMIDTSFLPT